MKNITNTTKSTKSVANNDRELPTAQAQNEQLNTEVESAVSVSAVVTVPKVALLYRKDIEDIFTMPSADSLEQFCLDDYESKMIGHFSPDIFGDPLQLVDLCLSGSISRMPRYGDIIVVSMIEEDGIETVGNFMLLPFCFGHEMEKLKEAVCEDAGYTIFPDRLWTKFSFVGISPIYGRNCRAFDKMFAEAS